MIKSTAYALTRVKRLCLMPPRVICFRILQAANRIKLERGGWKRISDRLRKTVDSPIFQNSLDERLRAAGRNVLVLQDGLLQVSAFAESAAGKAAWQSVMDNAEQIQAGSVRIFGVPTDVRTGWPWNCDWRVGKVWDGRGPFDFYEPRSARYDVKYPWELSRLKALVELLQAGIASDRDELVASGAALFRDWYAQNPLAASVNWVPMEASMRAIALVFAFELTAFDIDTIRRQQTATLLAQSLLEHGEYIWATREYADNRGNHYAANISALYLIGATLRGVHQKADRWHSFASKEVAKEACFQFRADGVNFEKSAAYHYLVLQLFLLAVLASTNTGEPLPPLVLARLQAAADFADCLVEPDGSIAAWGDSDDATALPLGADYPLSGGETLGLAAAIFGTQYRHARPSMTAMWSGLPFSNVVRKDSTSDERWFREGGFFVYGTNGSKFWCDLGEVGQNGLGGHGHNDLLSFALFLDGSAVVVDPGTFMYTGALDQRRWFRSTSAHNTIAVDGQEIAELLGHWRIANDAIPFRTVIQRSREAVEVSCGHSGYYRLPDPVGVFRTFRLRRDLSSVQVTDRIECAAAHHVHRFLHLAPGMKVITNGAIALVRGDGVEVDISFDDAAELSVEEATISRRYGSSESALVLIAANCIARSNSLKYTIERR
jgi:hypothetical protein